MKLMLRHLIPIHSFISGITVLIYLNISFISVEFLQFKIAIGKSELLR